MADIRKPDIVQTFADDSVRKRECARTIYLLKRAETAVKTALERALSDLGVTPGQYTTLTLVRTRREVSSAELARQAGITPQSASETIATLERKGWIERSESPVNRRILRIGLSEIGERLVADCDARVDRMEASLLRALDPSQEGILRDGLVAIVASAREGAPD